LKSSKHGTVESGKAHTAALKAVQAFEKANPRKSHKKLKIELERDE